MSEKIILPFVSKSFIFINEMRQIKDNLVYITGGSSGIGLELAKQLASKGANIVLIARNEEKLKKAADDVKKNFLRDTQRVSYISCDVSDYNEVEDRVRKGVENYGPPDILIANAGIGTGNTTLENMSFETFDRIMKVNVYGVWNVVKVLLPYLVEKKGHIVIISSAAGLFGMHDYTAYATSKGALNLFAESLRYEVKPLGVKVTLVCPPEVKTPFLQEEAKTLSPVGRYVKNLGGVLPVDYTAQQILKGIEKEKFCVVPGIRTKSFYFFHRISGGWSSRFVVDRVIKYARKKLNEK